MADQTIVVKDSSYRSHLNEPEGGNYTRTDAVNAAVELLHAAALGGAFSNRSGNRGEGIGEAVGPLADAIEKALKGS